MFHQQHIDKCVPSRIYEINERKSEQAHIPHAPTLPENAVYNEWQFKALVTGNQTENAYLQIMSFITIKFHEILLSGFIGVVLRNCFE